MLALLLVLLDQLMDRLNKPYQPLALDLQVLYIANELDINMLPLSLPSLLLLSFICVQICCRLWLVLNQQRRLIQLLHLDHLSLLLPLMLIDLLLVYLAHNLDMYLGMEPSEVKLLLMDLDLYLYRLDQLGKLLMLSLYTMLLALL